jgi:hypothetical protein
MLHDGRLKEVWAMELASMRLLMNAIVRQERDVEKEFQFGSNSG